MDISFVLSGKAGLAPLFAGNVRMRAIVDAVIEGKCGIAEADVDANVARLSLRPFVVLGGDAQHEHARELVSTIRPGSVIVAEQDWAKLVKEVHGDCLVSLKRTAFSPVSLDLDRLYEQAVNTPKGYVIRRVDFDSAPYLRDSISPELIPTEVFGSPSDFVERGVGFCATDGRSVVSAATSAVVSDRGAQIRVCTHPDHRGKGLGTAVAASLLAHCLTRQIVPHWDSDDVPSARLAERLGYTPDDMYDVFAVLTGGVTEELPIRELLAVR